ncbi:28S ribosomal protein S5, mitochondrial [Coemansia sp. RSA 989]|nr:28S ribosomal protein S5, mitochondrial [Coemansia sp. RSA 1086]KAJ1866324.1 28S ribosomal protein S5, mitochondrial [Coemansia sp. RSA 989]
MSAVTRVARTFTRSLGNRAFTSSFVSAKDDKPQNTAAGAYQNLSDLSKFDPIYDDIEENSSVINLWKQQKAAELGTGTSAMSQAELIVRKEHNIVQQNMCEPLNLPKYPPPKALMEDNEDTEMFWTEDLQVPYEVFRRLAKKTLVVKRTVQMTRKGKIPSMYALVVVGNGNGSAGYGEGKSNETAKAVLFATRNAIKNMTHIPRYDDRTLYHDIEHKFKATKLLLWARRPGFGCRVAPIIHEIFECIGIHDVAGKIHGSRNPMNVIKTVFEALKTQRIPSDLAKARGLRLIDVNHTYYSGVKPTPVHRISR